MRLGQLDGDEDDDDLSTIGGGVDLMEIQLKNKMIKIN